MSDAGRRYDFDLYTLGAGSGGVSGSRRAASYGARVGICESDRVGGTCVIRGCVPKKLLVYGASFAAEMRDAGGFGWSIPPAGFDWSELVQAKDREVDRLNGIYLKMLSDAGVALHEGHGRLVDAHTVEVDGKTYTARNILIATGGRVTLPAIPGIEHAITSNEALSLPSLPRRVVIVGGGYIALEFAGIFQALGAQVTLALRGDAPLRGFDGDVRSHVAQLLRAHGTDLRTGVQIVQIRREAAGLVACTDDGQEWHCDQILYATGRQPNTEGLGLAEAGVRTDGQGAVVVDAQAATSVPGVYAVGDVTNQLNLTPVAIAQARALVERLFNNNAAVFDPQLVPTAVFTQPPVATVGLTEEAARARGGAIDIYRTVFRPMRNTLSGNPDRVLMKLVVDGVTQAVLGCHMVGPDAPEIMQGLAIALRCGATKQQFDQTVGIHPTSAEEFVTMREKVAG